MPPSPMTENRNMKSLLYEKIQEMNQMKRVMEETHAKEIAAVRVQVRDWNEKYNEKEKVIVGLQEKLKESEANIAKKENEIKELKKKITEKEDEIRKGKEERELLQTKLSSKDSQLNSLADKLSEEEKKLKDEIATVKEQLAQKIAESVKQSKEHQDLKYTKEKEGKETKEHVSVLEETIAEKK